jgi:methylenetetrahydrofolate reductase (NADPH)
VTGADRLRARLRRGFTLTVEVVTPAAADAPARARVLALADAVRNDERVAALTLTDRTTSPDADPVAFAPEVLAHAGAPPLVHLAGKGRDAAALEDALRRCEAAGIGSVLLTGGDAPAGDAMDAVDMLRVAVARAPRLTRLAVLAPPRGVRGADAWERALAKREAGAEAFVAQVTWDPAERARVAEWQARLGAPVLGAVMLLTAGRLRFLAAHRIAGIRVPPALRGQVAAEDLAGARQRLALDLVALRRLGYAGAHVSGVLTPALLAGVLDDADRLGRVAERPPIA